MGLFDFLKPQAASNYSNAENENLCAIASRFRGSKEDTVFVTTSRFCPICSTYNRRVYSLFGRYKAFPVLPDFLKQAICPECGVHIGYSHYFPGINGNLQTDIKFSNRPFTDFRSTTEKKSWNERIQKQKLDEKINADFNWICSNLSDIAPKSIGGYKRMINANSSNYQKLVSAAKEKGYII